MCCHRHARVRLSQSRQRLRRCTPPASSSRRALRSTCTSQFALESVRAGRILIQAHAHLVCGPGTSRISLELSKRATQERSALRPPRCFQCFARLSQSQAVVDLLGARSGAFLSLPERHGLLVDEPHRLCGDGTSSRDLQHHATNGPVDRSGLPSCGSRVSECDLAHHFLYTDARRPARPRERGPQGAASTFLHHRGCELRRTTSPGNAELADLHVVDVSQYAPVKARLQCLQFARGAVASLLRSGLTDSGQVPARPTGVRPDAAPWVAADHRDRLRQHRFLHGSDRFRLARVRADGWAAASSCNSRTGNPYTSMLSGRTPP